ncbi:MAG: DNA polymerase III subunit beta [Clostridia bacterium]|nr:DNA polymerase III subunit beta [Clostridia bacterium]
MKEKPLRTFSSFPQPLLLLLLKILINIRRKIMKFTCSQSSLVKAINTVSKAVSTRTTIPILKGLLLEVKENKLIITASDLDLSIETKVDVSESEEGSLVVSAKLFGEIIRKLPNALIKVKKDEKENLFISCLSSDFSIVALPADEFPSIGYVSEENKIHVKKEAFKELIKKTTFSASIDEKKGILVGCLIEFNEKEIIMVALDGFRMAVAKESANVGKNKSIVVPARILNEINKIVSEIIEEEEIILLLDEKKMEIKTEDTRVISRLMEGEFIKYNEIIPKTYKTRCLVEREDFLNSIERASLLAKEGKNNLIKVSIKKGNMEITSRSEEGNVKEDVFTELEGEEIVIGFNSKYIMDVLKAVNDEEIILEMTTSTSSCLIKPVEGDHFVNLVLPVRIVAN